MESVLLVCTFALLALSVASAPTYSESEEAAIARQYQDEFQYLRPVRSQYTPQYVLPCAAAAAAAAAANQGQLSAYAAPYQLNVPGYHQQKYGYGVPHYRSVDEQMNEPEMLAFSDMDQFQHGQAMMMDHIPMARNGYGAPGAPISSNLALHGQVLTSASGAAYGIFPNANVGGCNVPLLFSCSPSISSGRMVESQAHGSQAMSPAASGNSYRLVDEPPHHEMHDDSAEMLVQHTGPAHEATHSQMHS